MVVGTKVKYINSGGEVTTGTVVLKPAYYDAPLPTIPIVWIAWDMRVGVRIAWYCKGEHLLKNFVVVKEKTARNLPAWW